ncbi:defender against death DAD protein [Corynespora cassiicola Philippines]|uniref:Dolichyl-diphosphooligosaccharide--protein glycosyltransferase subunit OST2 n=1 Tax=Corynespora cassiicola Philippines TaxID=1448308 RepID=A0A2T2NWA5_CORCC|nr:defender against death DAD protein [Corynespora cassiicola Philippines]
MAPKAKPAQQSSATSKAGNNDAQAIVAGVWDNYVSKTPQRVKLLDTFMAFLVFVGALQFLYCIIVGNFPFNAFLSGFSATVGQFVLTASLRIQTNPENKAEFASISHERAFADFVFGSVLLHFFCVNFIN